MTGVGVRVGERMPGGEASWEVSLGPALSGVIEEARGGALV